MSRLSGEDELLPAYAMIQLSGEDLVEMWASYYHYMDAVDEDSSALDGGDFQSSASGLQTFAGTYKTSARQACEAGSEIRRK